MAHHPHTHTHTHTHAANGEEKKKTRKRERKNQLGRASKLGQTELLLFLCLSVRERTNELEEEGGEREEAAALKLLKDS